MKKFNFNIKLTAFLVSLFIGLLLIILGSRVKLCFSFGFMVVGVALFLFVWYSSDKNQKQIIEIDDKINEAEIDKELNSDERTFVLGQLALQIRRLNRQQKRINILFSLTGAVLAVLGFINMF